MNTFSKVLLTLAAASLTWIALRHVAEGDEEARLEREVTKQLQALREHLFNH
jgi:predicted tellurium resistance membrane protein TerC